MTYPEFFGCLSCINEAGVGAFLNHSNNRPSFLKILGGGPYTPIGYTIRDGLEIVDFDGDLDNDGDDVVRALEGKHFGSSLVQVVEPESWDGSRARVVELHTIAGWAIRLPEDDPQIGPSRLAATNRHRVLSPPESCWRYDIMIEEVETRQGRFDVAGLWDLMKKVAFTEDLVSGFTNQTILYRMDTMEVGVAKTDEDGFSVDKQPIWFSLLDLLTHPSRPDDDVVRVAAGVRTGLGFLWQ